MDQSIVLATVVEATPARIFDVLSTSNGLAAIWTADCDVGPRRARFGFAHSPRDVEVDVTTERDRMVRMRVTSDHPPFCKDSTWEWELREIAASPASTGILFRHYGFEDGYPEFDFARRAQTWALILERLSGKLKTGVPQTYFPLAA